MLLAIVRNWWVLLVRGICAVLFGLLAFTWPGLTLFALVILYGAYALADGVTAIWLAFAGGPHENGRMWWQMLIVGLLGIAAGIVTFAWPGVTALVLLVLIACWAIVRGIFEIAAAIRLRKVIEHEWMLAAAGVLSVLFGIVLLARPGAGALALIWVIGAFAIIWGAVAIGLSFKLRGLKVRWEHDHGIGGHPPMATA
jgi:uncharacterized membrane protein HdeD (DUF308 family)